MIGSNLRSNIFARPSLRQFMDQEGRRQWIEFWLAANNFRSQWTSQNASDDALIIYNKYFSLQASQSLGLADGIRLAIEENICSGVKCSPGPDCFEQALQVVLSVMEKVIHTLFRIYCVLFYFYSIHNVLSQKYLHKFLTSQTYQQYFTEINSAFKNTSNLTIISRNKRSGNFF